MTMRKFVKTIAALLIVISAAHVAFPIDSTLMEARFKVWEVEDGTYRLIYKNSGEQQIQIEFIDENQQILYSELIHSEEGFIKPFDLNSLPAGTYTFKLTSDQGTYSESITIKTASEKYSDLISIKEFQDSKQFSLALNQQADTELSMYILDEAGNTIYEEQLSSGTKLYNLSQVASSQVTVLVYNQDGMIKESTVKL